MCSPSTETETWTFSDVWFSADRLELSFPACVCHFFQHHGKASAPPLPLPTPKSTLSLDLSFKFYDDGGDSPLSNAYSVSVLSLSLSLSLAWTSSQGAVLYPAHGGMPHRYEEYMSFFDPIKRVVSQVFTSEFNLERELPVSQWGAMIPLPPSYNSSMASISFIFIIKSKTLGLAYKVWSVPIVLVSLLVSCWSCSPLSHGLPQDMCTCYFCLKCSSSSSFLVFT